MGVRKPFFSLGTSPCLNLPVTATVLCQSFSGACSWMEPGRLAQCAQVPGSTDMPAAPGASLYRPVWLLLKTTTGKHILSFEGDNAAIICNTYDSYGYNWDSCPLSFISYCFELERRGLRAAWEGIKQRKNERLMDTDDSVVIARGKRGGRSERGWWKET